MYLNQDSTCKNSESLPNEKLILTNIVLFVYALFFNIQVRLTEIQPLTTKYNVLPSKSVYQISFIATGKSKCVHKAKPLLMCKHVHYNYNSPLELVSVTKMTARKTFFFVKEKS